MATQLRFLIAVCDRTDSSGKDRRRNDHMNSTTAKQFVSLLGTRRAAATIFMPASLLDIWVSISQVILLLSWRTCLGLEV